jgi:hypothetical protein
LVLFYGKVKLHDSNYSNHTKKCIDKIKKILNWHASFILREIEIERRGDRTRFGEKKTIYRIKNYVFNLMRRVVKLTIKKEGIEIKNKKRAKACQYSRLFFQLLWIRLIVILGKKKKELELEKEMKQDKFRFLMLRIGCGLVHF